MVITTAAARRYLYIIVHISFPGSRNGRCAYYLLLLWLLSISGRCFVWKNRKSIRILNGNRTGMKHASYREYPYWDKRRNTISRLRELKKKKNSSKGFWCVRPTRDCNIFTSCSFNSYEKPDYFHNTWQSAEDV